MTDAADSDRDADSGTVGERGASTNPGARVRAPVVGPPGNADLSLDTVFDLLRNERRQYVLSYLVVSDDESVSIGDLAEHIAAIENDKPVDAISSQQRKRVYVALYQVHLPKMANADVIEFNKSRGIVERGPNIDQLEPYLDKPGEDAPEDVPLQYVLLAGTGILGYLLAALVRPGGDVAGGVVVLAGAIAFLFLQYRDY